MKTRAQALRRCVSNFGLGVFKLRSQSVDISSKLGTEARTKGLIHDSVSCSANRKSKVRREAAMIKGAQPKDVKQMSLLELATLQAKVMDRLMAGKMTLQEADIISETAEERMRSIKREFSAH
jgi:hypothetical protein